MRTSVIIPALNEAESLGRLLAEIPSGPAHEIIVVDNGSRDRTAEVARGAGAILVEEPRAGYGWACSAGASCAHGDVLVFMDGDGSFAAGDIPGLLAPLDSGEADLVLGSRFRQGRVAMPRHQRFGNLLFAWLLNRRHGLALTDLGPFRAIRRGLLADLAMRERTYGWPLEMIVKTANRGGAIREVPVSYRPRSGGRSKVGGTVRGTVLTAYRFGLVALRYGL